MMVWNERDETLQQLKQQNIPLHQSFIFADQNNILTFLPYVQ